MKLVLALEASSRTYAVAVGAGEKPQAQRAARRDDPGFAGLGELVTQTLAEAGAEFRDIGTIAVDIGPGGLSTIRSVVAYVNGLAFSLGVPIFPVSSLELMAIAAAETHRGPFLCVKRGQGGATYAGTFVDGEMAEIELAELSYGPPAEVLPAMVANLAAVCVVGGSRDEVSPFLPGVAVEDAGIAEADVVTLYRAGQAAAAKPDQLVPVTTALNEASRIFHEPAAPHPAQRR